MDSSNNDYQCKYKGCEKSYSTNYNLKRHIESFHQCIKKFQCELCFKYLSSNQNLQEHKSTHSKECLYKCEEPGCLKLFRQRSKLSSHNKIHRELDIFKQQLKSNERVDLNEIEDAKNMEEIVDMVIEPIELIQLPPILAPQLMVKLPNILIIYNFQ